MNRVKEQTISCGSAPKYLLLKLLIFRYLISALLRFKASSWQNNVFLLEPGSPHVNISCKTNDTLASVELHYKKYGGINWTLPAAYDESRINEQDQEFNIKGLTKVDEGFYQCYAIKRQTPHHFYLGYLGFGEFTWIRIFIWKKLFTAILAVNYSLFTAILSFYSGK